MISALMQQTYDLPMCRYISQLEGMPFDIVGPLRLLVFSNQIQELEKYIMCDATGEVLSLVWDEAKRLNNKAVQDLYYRMLA